MLSRSLGKGTSFTGQQTTVLGIGVAFMAFTSVVIALRVYVRTLLLRAWGADDVLMVIGTILTYGLSIASIVAAYYGVGKHYSDVHIEDRIPMFKASYNTNTEEDDDPLTITSQKFYEVNGILVIVMDILIWAVPIPMLWRVRISLRKKIAVLGVFSVGLLSIAAACVRYNTVLQLANNPDETYVLAASLNWCGIEAYVAIFCGSTPALYVFVKRYLPQILGPSYAHNPTYPGQSNAKRFSAPFCRVSRQDVSESRLGESQDALHDGDGIMLKTDIRWEVTDIDAEGRVDSHHVNI
ncbi:hypothetical protein CBS76997_7329 [Aspergillus niger]|nr:hypothetical protein CBS13152_7957 [Aspergillus niger]KAI2967234.1 hypothetical protein CBS147323_5074 [Aspergillus niger]KAI3027481.1 hypothetical protein CBS147347_4340 [Aspergillus niger]KAI3040458.1 hypothetical protein CBS76997_7329 [Aspergillus niger]KAI3065616.1 hypothetical protein CBS147353_8264 [Aspergillus niger]